jgi:hypothetical protein
VRAAPLATQLVGKGFGVVTDGVAAYFVERREGRATFRRVTLAGGAIEKLYETAADVHRLSLLGDQLYWFEASGGGPWQRVVRMARTGGAVEEFVREANLRASYVVGDATNVVWSSFLGIRRAPR